MPDWDEEFGQLAREFLQSGPRRLVAIDEALHRVEAGDPTGLQDLRRETHRLVGTGATYGCAAISDMARLGEQRCQALIDAATGPAEADMRAWRGMRADLANAFADALTSAPQATLDEPAGGAVGATGPRILVVDPGRNSQERLGLLLAHEGLEVIRVRSAEEARAEMARQLPDGIIVDFHLPDGDGYDLVRHLRSQAGGEAPAAVVVGHVDDLLDQIEAIHAGADACYTKPGEMDAAVRRMLQLLERARADAPRVLMVEDDESHAKFARSVLAAAGYQVEVCAQPRDFSERLAHFRPDLILMDVNLPEISGYDLARVVRQREQHATLPIIFLTSESEMAARIEAAEAGGDEHLAKPVHPALLASTVGVRLERARLLHGLLHRDGLTRLLTHASFMEQVQQTLERQRRGQIDRACLVMLDVDHFKVVNDTYGHQAGDRVLVALAGILRRHLRRIDVVGRYGGEEFAILLEQVNDEGASRLTERLLAQFSAIEHAPPGGGPSFRCTFSAGVAALAGWMDHRVWVAAADRALYTAKRAGRNRVAGGGAPMPPGSEAT
jgi:diguanylate cyclase (GGDEF)-like protein